MHERVEPIPWKDGSTVATVGAPSMAANCKSPERSVPSKSWRAAECATPLITGIGFAVRYFRVQSKPRATGRREPEGRRKGATELCDRRGGRRRCFAGPYRTGCITQPTTQGDSHCSVLSCGSVCRSCVTVIARLASTHTALVSQSLVGLCFLPIYLSICICVCRILVRHCRQGGRHDRLHRLCKPARAVDPLGDAVSADVKGESD